MIKYYCDSCGELMVGKMYHIPIRDIEKEQIESGYVSVRIAKSENRIYCEKCKDKVERILFHLPPGGVAE